MHAVLIEDLRKNYGKTAALAGLDLAVPAGSVCGLLGPNGAGKTTAVRIVATLARPDSGRVVVAGWDAARRAARVRERISLAGQHAAVDENLTGRENLILVGRLRHLGGRGAKARADELLTAYGLDGAADRLVKGYSGGMQRRLDLVASLVVPPAVLLLDEPTTGLDPRSRAQIWEQVGRMAAQGTTVLLTTQYLDEADRLCDRIAVVDHGRAVADGTARELKDRIGARITVTVVDVASLGAAARVLATFGAGEPFTDAERRSAGIAVEAGGATVPGVVRALDAAGVAIEDAALQRPTLDEVFLRLTGSDPEPPRDVEAEYAAGAAGEGES
ncbi:MAG TPA: ATP-binding cassette domain-containing protein [Actinocrinis sp.]|jgi:ABC-2 type transport system ATP-binding protein